MGKFTSITANPTREGDIMSRENIREFSAMLAECNKVAYQAGVARRMQYAAENKRWRMRHIQRKPFMRSILGMLIFGV